MSNTQIADFEVGRAVEGVFAVVRKQRRHGRNGDPFLVLELSDSTGTVESRVWRNADWFDRNVSEGDRVRVVGTASRFRETMQLDVRRLERIGEPTGESFIPASRREVAELAGELDFLVDELTTPGLRELTATVWQGDARERLLRSPATALDHHAYLAGLVEHTVNVAASCIAAAERHERVDRDLLLAAALLHDIGRSRELEVTDAIRQGADGGLYGHLLLGHEMLLDAAGSVRSVRATEQRWWPGLVHAMQQHHMTPDRCRTREAMVLASCNSLDAKLGVRDRD